jgi:cystathionine gamma-synthase
LFGEDAIFLERNSRDFISRIEMINRNTEMLCDMFEKRRKEDEEELQVETNGNDDEEKKKKKRKNVISKVYYPKFTSASHYLSCLRNFPSQSSPPPSAYGGLFSICFKTLRQAQVFYDNLPFPKGPSLGTNFTLACPYTLLAHFKEMEWAKGWGVVEELVRVSVGIEEGEVLMNGMKEALRMAEECDE